MKTTKFFSEIKKVAKDSMIVSMFDYSVSHVNRFYEIILQSEPSKKVQDMCKKNNFSIKENISNCNEGGKMVAHTVWEVCPINIEDIEFVSDEFHCINEDVIIASDQAMIDAGLFKCNPREGQLTLWVYMLNSAWNEWQWTPITQVFDKPLTEDIVDDNGRVIELKSTHKVDKFYATLVYDNIDFTRFFERYNIPVEKL